MKNIKIRDLKIQDNKKIEKLFIQLTSRPVNFDPKFLIKNKLSHCRIIIEDSGKIIGFAALIIHPTPTKGLVGRVEDVVIDKNYREKGYGRLLMEDLIGIAKKKRIKILTLTSNSSRIPARKLYESLGFQLLDTGIFWMNI